MFFHNFKYSLKTLIRNKILIFWTFAFPLILATFFNMAFSDIESSEKLDVIKIAVVDNEEFLHSQVYKKVLSELSNEENEDRLFDIEYVDESEAKRLLENKDIRGYLLMEDGPHVVVHSNGIDETVFEYTIEQIEESTAISEVLLTKELATLDADTLSSSEKMSRFYEDFYAKLAASLEEESVSLIDESSPNLSYTMIEFYTLIAMTCLYGGILGVFALNQRLADMSSKGKRVAVSPFSKANLVLSTVLASYLIQLFGVGLLFVYTIFGLGVDYGSEMFFVLLLTTVGSLAGLCLGVFLAAVFKTSEDTKTGIIIAVTMFGCFLAGMMGITMKYIIDVNAPILNMINPANMITDGFYSLYYYGTGERFYFNLTSLLIFSAIMISISMVSLRRKKYDSI